MLNYDDFIWNKYQIGAWLKVTDPSTGQPTVKNPFYPSKAGAALHYNPDSPESLYQDTSIQALQQRGVKLQGSNNLDLFFRYAETEVQPIQRVFDVVQEPAIRNRDNVVQLLNLRRVLRQLVEFA
jgi:hypothetical protein